MGSSGDGAIFSGNQCLGETGQVKALLRQDIQVATSVNGRVSERAALLLGGCYHGSLIQIEQVVDELVRMLYLDAECRQPFCREVPLVEGDDHARIAADGCGKDMPVIRVGQGQAVDQVFMPGDQSIRDSLVHEIDSSPQMAEIQLGTVPQQVSNPLVMDQGRPACAEPS